LPVFINLTKDLRKILLLFYSNPGVHPEGQLANYSNYWKFLEEYPVTDLEKKVRKLQFEQFQGIVPEVTNDEILIKFNLFEIQDTAVI